MQKKVQSTVIIVDKADVWVDRFGLRGEAIGSFPGLWMPSASVSSVE